MEVRVYESRSIDILVDQDKNIVLFPYAQSNELMDFPPEYPIRLELKDGPRYFYKTAKYPIELKFPYTVELLAEKIEFAFNEWGKHKCYAKSKKFECEYYGIKSFKEAMRGKRYISVSYDDYQGKMVTLFFPRKANYSYYGSAISKLPEDADWIDFAKAVLNYINIDITTLDTFRTFRRELNI